METFVRATLVILLAAGTLTAQSQGTGAITDGDLTVFENKLLRQALTREEEGRWHDALRAWNALNALRPDNRRYQDQVRTLGSAIQSRVSEHLGAARTALARGSHDAAIELLLKALVLDPHGTEASALLREAEAGRVEAQLRSGRARGMRP